MTSNDFIELAVSIEAELKRYEHLVEPLQRVAEVADKVGGSHSGSWMGYHSRVYYENFADPPAGADFSVEWGLMHPNYFRGTVGDWKEYAFEDVERFILKSAGDVELDELKKQSQALEEVFEDQKRNALSILEIALKRGEDIYLSSLKSQVGELDLLSSTKFVSSVSPKGRMMSRDSEALMAGSKVPPHIEVCAAVFSIISRFDASTNLAKLARSAAQHIQRWELTAVRKGSVGTKVFIGHGRSSAWRDLKDFVSDRLGLPWDEFNRTPVAGLPNVARLAQMLDDAAIAFLVMTAEDERSDGKMQARMNVIHEAELFQGRLGFEKAIILLEDECEEFSNIQGLGQIRFSVNSFSSTFEDIRRVLERENIIPVK